MAHKRRRNNLFRIGVAQGGPVFVIPFACQPRKIVDYFFKRKQFVAEQVSYVTRNAETITIHVPARMAVRSSVRHDDTRAIVAIHSGQHRKQLRATSSHATT